MRRAGVLQADFSSSQNNENRLPLLAIYNDELNKILLQISDLHLFFEHEEISSDDIEALLYKTGIITDLESITKAAIEKSDKLPIVLENIEEVDVDKITYEVDINQELEKTLEPFNHKSLVDQFIELFKLTEDPLDTIIKGIEPKGDDKYAAFNFEDVEFYPDALNTQI